MQKSLLQKLPAAIAATCSIAAGVLMGAHPSQAAPTFPDYSFGCINDSMYVFREDGSRFIEMAVFSGAGGISSVQRCNVIASSFRTANTFGHLQYITHENWSGSRVVCTADEPGGLCSGMLFTLTQSRSPWYGDVAVSRLSQRLASPGTRTAILYDSDSRVYLDMEAYLETAFDQPEDESVAVENENEIWAALLEQASEEE